MSVSTKDNKIVVTVPAEMKEQFKKLADAEGRSLSNYVIQVLKKHIEQIQEKQTQENSIFSQRVNDEL